MDVEMSDRKSDGDCYLCPNSLDPKTRYHSILGPRVCARCYCRRIGLRGNGMPDADLDAAILAHEASAAVKDRKERDTKESSERLQFIAAVTITACVLALAMWTVLK